MTIAIETVDLTRRFGRTEAVNGLNLRVPAGSIFALLGPNGAGKTTTLKVLMNLVRATRGSATVLGVDSRRLGPREFERIGYVSENQRLPEWMTPGQLFDYCRPFYPNWDNALQAKLESDLGLTSRAPLRTLSRGTRMKAALLASLAYRPDLVVLDEPFTGLDPLVRDELVRGLLEVAGERHVDGPHLVARHRRRRAAGGLGGVHQGWAIAVCRAGVGAARALPARRSRAGGRHAAADAGGPSLAAARHGRPHAPVRGHASRRAGRRFQNRFRVSGVRRPDVAASAARDLRHARAQRIDRIGTGLA